MAGRKAPERRHTVAARGVAPDDDGLIGVKMATGGTTGELLRKRSRSELEAVRGLLQKAELLVAGNDGAGAVLSKARPPTSSGKNGRFLLAEASPKAHRAGAKRRKAASPLVEVIEPRMSRNERERLGGRLSSLSAELPAHIVEFMQRQCSRVAVDAVRDGGEVEINLYSTGDVSLFQLKELLDEFADERKRRLEAEPGPRPPKDVEAADASGAVSKDEEDEFVDICGDASPVVLEKKLPETGDGDSPSSSGSSSSSSSSGSSCSSDSSDEDESASSSPAAPAVLPIGAAAQEEKLERAAPPAGPRISDLIAKAQEEKRTGASVSWRGRGFVRSCERRRGRRRRATA